MIESDEKTKRTNISYRPTPARPGLEARLNRWLIHEHSVDSLRSVRPPHLILSHSQRFELVRAHPKRLKSVSDITTLLNESSEWESEWASKIYGVITQFNVDFAALSSTVPQKRKA